MVTQKKWTVLPKGNDPVLLFSLVLIARVIKRSGLLDKLKERAEATATPLDNALVRAAIALIDALSGTLEK